MNESEVSVRPIRDDDARAIGQFLHHHLNQAVSAEAWTKLILPPWQGEAPNHGFQLLNSGEVVGAYVAVYSFRDTGRSRIRVCNLAAFCVREEFRMHGLRLVRALLAQKGYDFTDLSPSGAVVGLDERLGFRRLDTSTRLIANLPNVPRREVRVTGDPAVLEQILRGRDADIYRDHRNAAAARHVLVERDGNYGYLLFRRDRRKNLPLFASPIFVGGDRNVLEASWTSVASHILLRHRIPMTLAERRILGFARGPGVELREPRPKMHRGVNLDSDGVDYLYSELVLVEW